MLAAGKGFNQCRSNKGGGRLVPLFRVPLHVAYYHVSQLLTVDPCARAKYLSQTLLGIHVLLDFDAICHTYNVGSAERISHFAPVIELISSNNEEIGPCACGRTYAAQDSQHAQC